MSLNVEFIFEFKEKVGEALRVVEMKDGKW